jgi:kynurenine 3-monooxygenase
MPDSPADIVLVGAGPVGSLLALALAQRGLNVEVFERRHDMRKHTISAGRSINLAVSTRGLHGLHLVGLEQEVLTHTVPMYGRFLHAQDGATRLLRYGRDDSEHISSMSRGGLNQLLMMEAEKTGRVKLHFRQRLVQADLANRTLTLHDEDTDVAQMVTAPVVIGTDGSASVLRSALAQQAGAEVTESLLSAGYKELTMSARAVPGEHGYFAMYPKALHIWPRGKFMVIALANPDGTFTCTLFLAHTATSPETGDAEPSFATLHDDAQVLAFFVQYFPDFVLLVPDLLEQFNHAPIGHMVTVKTWPWSQGAVGLCGDAAHAIVPFFGQGMNAGFEDVAVLMAMLDAAPKPWDWSTLLAEFAQARKANTDAIADLAVENFVEMRDKVADPTFLLHRAVEAELDKRLGGTYRSRYQLVTFTRVPYLAAKQAGAIQAEVLSEVCAGKKAVEEVNLDRAEALMRARLLPFLAQHGL